MSDAHRNLRTTEDFSNGAWRSRGTDTQLTLFHRDVQGRSQDGGDGGGVPEDNSTTATASTTSSSSTRTRSSPTTASQPSGTAASSPWRLANSYVRLLYPLRAECDAEL